MYLAGARFKIITDIVVGIHLQQPKQEATRENREIVYVLGKVPLYSGLQARYENTADYMSRHPVHALKGAAEYCEQRPTEAVVKSNIRRNVPQALSIEEIREAIKKDQETRDNDEDLKPSQMEHS